MFDCVKNAWTNFSKDECTSLSASLAFYTVFALPPLLYLLLMALSASLSIAFDTQQAEERAKVLVQSQLAHLIGNQSASEEIGVIIEQTNNQGGTWWKSIISFAGIIIGATGVMGCLQASLNRIFKVQMDPSESVVKQFFLKRIISLAMILGFGFLLLVSFALTAILSAITSAIGQAMHLEETMGVALNETVAFLIATAMFAILLKYLPDVMIRWQDAALGALVTGVLFTAGKIGLQVYLSFSDPGAQLGSAAASLAVILIWVYYSAMIFLFGAEFTKAWADHQGHVNPPESGAVSTAD